MNNETKLEIEKSKACEEFIFLWITNLPPKSEYRKDPLLTIMAGNLRNAWYEGSKFKPNAEDYTVQELTIFSENNFQ